jgi:uncharacterized protein (TIGR02117 family)
MPRPAMKHGAWLCLLVVVLCGGACVGPIEKPGPAAGADEPAVPIFLVNQGWHTDLVIPRADIPKGIWPESEEFAEADYLVIGWGDREFYQSPEVGFWMTLKAALWPTASVLHVTHFNGPVKTHYPASEIIELKPSAGAFRNLCRYIHDSYQRAGARAVALAPDYYPTSRFYPAHESFHLFRTCNAWTASALRAAGFSVSPLSALFSSSLMSEVRALGKPVR